MNTPSDYNLDKPLVIGEFSSSCSGDNTIEEIYKYFYENKFDGAWAWQLFDDGEGHCSDGKENTLSQVFKIGLYDSVSLIGQRLSQPMEHKIYLKTFESGIAAIQGRTDHGKIKITLGKPNYI